MPIHREEQPLPYTTSQIFQLVADIEKYPDFLPWCRGARVLNREGHAFLGELVICYKHICEQYTSRVALTPPANEHGPCRIDVSLVRGPFHHLDNLWEFIPEGDATRVRFVLDFQFRSKILDMMIGGMFHKATQKIVGAFRERAESMYGQKP